MLKPQTEYIWIGRSVVLYKNINHTHRHVAIGGERTVRIEPTRGRWLATITRDHGNPTHSTLGRYASEAEAIEAAANYAK